MKTLQELNGRWWYRLIKSLYVLSFIVVAIIGTWTTYNDHKPYTWKEIKVANPQQPLSIFNVTSTQVTVGSNAHAIWYSILTLLVIAIVFEIGRRIFYYIVLGTLRPRRA